MSMDVITMIDMLGLLAFAFVGAMKAIGEELDLLGVLVLGLVYALGGGIVRDVLLNRSPNVFSSATDVGVAALGVIIAATAYTRLKKDVSTRYYIMIPDALGLSAFTVTGAVIAYQAEASLWGLVFLSVVTAVGGGAIGDLLLGRIPSVLRTDCYATCAIIGAVSFGLGVRMVSDLTEISLLCIGVTFSLRMLAIQWRWALPKLT